MSSHASCAGGCQASQSPVMMFLVQAGLPRSEFDGLTMTPGTNEFLRRALADLTQS
jgi:hypothetical protein